MYIFHEFFELVKSGGLSFLFLLVFLEANPIIGSFIPGQVLIVFVGFLISTTNIFGLWVTIFWVFLAAFLGDLLGFYIGRRYGLKGLKTFGINKENGIYKSSYSFFKKYGRMSIILGRQFNLTRAFMPFLAGCFRVKVHEFIIISLISCALWAVISIFLGYYFGFIIIDNLNFVMEFILLLILYVIFIIFIYKGTKSFFKERREIFRKYALHNIIFLGFLLIIFCIMIFFAKTDVALMINDYFRFIDFAVIGLVSKFLLSKYFILGYFFAMMFVLISARRFRISIVYFWGFIFSFFFTLIISMFLKIWFNILPFFSIILITIFVFYNWVLIRIFYRKSKYYTHMNVFLTIFLFMFLFAKFFQTANLYIVLFSFLIGVMQSELILLLSHYQILDRSLSDCRYDQAECDVKK